MKERKGEPELRSFTCANCLGAAWFRMHFYYVLHAGLEQVKVHLSTHFSHLSRREGNFYLSHYTLQTNTHLSTMRTNTFLRFPFTIGWEWARSTTIGRVYH